MNDVVERVARAKERYVIRRGGAFFRPNAQGYTTHVGSAGFYSKAEAESYLSVEGVSIHPLSEYRDEALRVIENAKRVLAALADASPDIGKEGIGNDVR